MENRLIDFEKAAYSEKDLQRIKETKSTEKQMTTVLIDDKNNDAIQTTKDNE